MKSKLLATLCLLSYCLSGAFGQNPSGYQWIVRAPDGPFTLTVPDVTLATSGTKTFNVTMSDWDKYEDPQNYGTFASMGGLSATLSFVSPATLPTGISLDFDSFVSASASQVVVKYKFTTSNATPVAFTILWKAVDTGGWDFFDNQVGKDPDQSVLQTVGF